jgi:glycerol uptake facilitator-like aquaporin
MRFRDVASDFVSEFIGTYLLVFFGCGSEGTFLLVFLISSLTAGCNIGRPDNSFAPLFIGLTVALINPARDLSPRILSYLARWGQASFQITILVYSFMGFLQFSGLRYPGYSSQRLSKRFF